MNTSQGPYQVNGVYKFGVWFQGEFAGLGYCRACEGHLDAMAAAAHYQQFRAEKLRPVPALDVAMTGMPRPLAGAGATVSGPRLCPDCGEMFTVTSLPNVGYLKMRCDPCQQTAADGWEVAAVLSAERGARAAIESLWPESGIGRHHLAERFTTFRLDGVSGSVRVAYERCLAWADAYSPDRFGRGLLLAGPAGTGKTHLAVAIARLAMERSVPTLEALRADRAAEREAMRLAAESDERYQPVAEAQRPRKQPAMPNEFTMQFWEAPVLLGRLQDGRFMGEDKSKMSEEQVYQHVAAARLLVLDDLGRVNRRSQREEQPEMWYRLFNSRYTSERPMIVTTNMPVDGLADVVGDAVVDRLCEMVDLVDVEGESFRPRKRSNG